MYFQTINMKTSYDASTNQWSGIKELPKYGPDTSIGQFALESLLKDPDHIAQICAQSGKSYTNREIANLSIRAAQYFKTLQLKQCDIIGICASNSDYLAPIFFGAMLTGLTVSTLDPSFDTEGIKHIYSVTKPKILFCDGSVYESAKRAFKECGLSADIYTMNTHLPGVPDITEFIKETGNEKNFIVEPLKLGNAQIATILCSSGTTGLPKGVCMSHGSLMNLTTFPLEPDHKMLCFSTLYWLSGLFALTSGTFQGATRIIAECAFSPELFFNSVEKYKVTVAISPPSQVAMSVASPKIGDFDLSSIQLYLCGGSAVPHSLVDKLIPYLPNAKVVVGYGMSEVCGFVSYGTISPNDSVGYLVSNVNVKIIDENRVNLGPGEVGELCIKTSYPWAGYYGNPKATASTYDEDGWIHSGDLGYFNTEGEMFIVDRKKDIYKYNNFHFYPTEIENVIYEIPGVSAVCVCGIPDITSTHLPTAAIIREQGNSLSEDEVYQYVESKMTHFKHLRGGVFFVDSLPKTASGKYIRRQVEDMCLHLRDNKKQNKTSIKTNA